MVYFRMVSFSKKLEDVALDCQRGRYGRRMGVRQALARGLRKDEEVEGAARRATAETRLLDGLAIRRYKRQVPRQVPHPARLTAGAQRHSWAGEASPNQASSQYSGAVADTLLAMICTLIQTVIIDLILPLPVFPVGTG
jgi:hypothetical protein